MPLRVGMSSAEGKRFDRARRESMAARCNHVWPRAGRILSSASARRCDWEVRGMCELYGGSESGQVNLGSQVLCKVGATMRCDSGGGVGGCRPSCSSCSSTVAESWVAGS